MSTLDHLLHEQTNLEARLAALPADDPKREDIEANLRVMATRIRAAELVIRIDRLLASDDGEPVVLID